MPIDRRLSNAWLDAVPTGPACTVDVDCGAVDAQSPWVRVRGRPCSSGYVALGLTLRAAMEHHPSLRAAVKGVNTALYAERENLPLWVRGRLAVLDMAPEAARIRGVGKRWGVSYNTSRFYTLEVNCEKEPE